MATEGNLLVIDDEEGVRDLLKAEFNQRGYNVVSAANGYEALRLLADQSFDVALCDIRMPGMDGLETLTCIRSQFPDLQVIIMTGYASIEAVLSVMKKGAYDFVEKPFHLDHVASLVTRALEHRNMRAIVGIYEMSRTVFETMDLDNVLKTIAKNVQRITAADEVSVLMRRGTQDWEPAVTPENAAAEWSADHRALAASVQFSDAHQPYLAPDAILEKNPGIASALFCPLHAEGDWQSLLLAVRRPPRDAFLPLDVRYATIFASFGAQAVKNARLYDQLIQRWKELDDAHRSLRETKNHLIQNEKMAAVGQLAAGIAHELNNPMTGIMGFSQLLSGDASLSAQQHKDVETIYQQSRRCQKIIQNLLQFSRRRDPVVKKVDLRKTIETAEELARYESSADQVRIDLKFPEGSLLVHGDAADLQHLFLNLLRNARQAMQGRTDARIDVDVTVQNSWVSARVRDNGPGIDPLNLSRIFDPFFTTKPVGEGTGLGLSLSQTIVKNYGGRLSVESDLGKGCVFTVEFPRIS